VSRLLTYHRDCNKINTTDATSGSYTPYPFGPHEFTLPPLFIGVWFAQSLVVCFIDRCLSFCPFFHLVIVLSLLLRLRILITPLGHSNFPLLNPFINSLSLTELRKQQWQLPYKKHSSLSNYQINSHCFSNSNDQSHKQIYNI
jgi:hypothetical protein